jgi:hypothetical protein
MHTRRSRALQTIDSTGRVSQSATSYARAQNSHVWAPGTTFAYRELGPRGGIPLILLNHWGAVLDNFDPRIVDGLARKHRIIASTIAASGYLAAARP